MDAEWGVQNTWRMPLKRHHALPPETAVTCHHALLPETAGVMASQGMMALHRPYFWVSPSSGGLSSRALCTASSPRRP
jgi:hypothetical protein